MVEHIVLDDDMWVRVARRRSARVIRRYVAGPAVVKGRPAPSRRPAPRIPDRLRASTWRARSWNRSSPGPAARCGIPPTGAGRGQRRRPTPRIVGLSEETTCFVSPDYFAEDDPFADFIVHEAAHIFHNCKRRTIGLRATRRKEWLLDIEFGQRETFAYACEAYARIVARATRPAERRAAEYGAMRRISAARVDPAEVAGIVAEAASAPARTPRVT